MFSILFLMCLLAPMAAKWAAYIHCNIAASAMISDCGCDILLTNHKPEQNDHSAPASLVQQYFLDWQFEKPLISINISPVYFSIIHIAFTKEPTLPNTWVPSIFHPPGC